MSYNHSYYAYRGNDNTFQRNFRHPKIVPPPPQPPPFFIVPAPPPPPISDQDFLKKIESKLPTVPVAKKSEPFVIAEFRDKVKDLLCALNELKSIENDMSENRESYSDEEWNHKISEINQKKYIVNENLSTINDTYVNIIKKQLTKRIAKRLRQKHLRTVRKRMREDRMKELEERSRKIDENLQKIKDSIYKAKQEEEAKIQADHILKEVLRKKHDARKCLNKLDALRKLHKARLNTAKGSGQTVSAHHIEEFDSKIENIKLLWAKKLETYEKEESQLRLKLEEDSVQNAEVNNPDGEITATLRKWQQVLFGDENAIPQVDFYGDVNRFVSVRSQWDQYLSEEGTPLPVGWVTPTEQRKVVTPKETI